MRNKSHAAMGRILLRRFMPQLPRQYRRVFLLGCTQPDKNPATYLKGSLRSQWLRGHNYANAHRYMIRLANRLERKERFSLWDCYSLGKLIHYTMDAFTLAHNQHFPIRAHRAYEARLQRIFLLGLHQYQLTEELSPLSAAEIIRKKHAMYMLLPGSCETDIEFACNVCFQLAQIFADKIPCQPILFPRKKHPAAETLRSRQSL